MPNTSAIGTGCHFIQDSLLEVGHYKLLVVYVLLLSVLWYNCLPKYLLVLNAVGGDMSTITTQIESILMHSVGVLLFLLKILQSCIQLNL